MTKQKRGSWRSHLRFGLRSLLALVLVIGGWLGWVVQRARLQRGAVVAIERAGGHVQYDWQWNDGVTLNGKPWGWSWLVDSVGVDYFGHVTGVSFPPQCGPKAETALSFVRRLDRVQGISIASSSVTDAGLAHIKGLKDLRELYLFNARVTDAGLADLKGLKNLNRLHLNRTAVTEAGIREIQAALPNLKITPSPQLSRSRHDRFRPSSSKEPNPAKKAPKALPFTHAEV